MIRVTFGVSPSSFAANMSVKRNALDHALEFPKAADAVERSFYVDDCLAGANSVEEAVDLHQQLFAKGGFLLRKWNSSDPVVLCNISPELRDMQSTHHIPSPDEYTKTLGMPTGITFASVASLPNTANVTKQTLTSDIDKTFDILGWFSPRIGWDNLLPPTIYQSWLQWRSELHLLVERHIPCCYCPRDADVNSVGFCDASEDAYAGIVYFHAQDRCRNVHLSIVVSKPMSLPYND